MALYPKECYFYHAVKLRLFKLYDMKKCALQVKVVKVFLLSLLLCLTSFQGYSTVWTTSTAGNITTLTNWTDGTASPTTFTTPGDTWTVTHPMTMSSGAAWTVGTAGMALDTVTIASGGSITGSGGSFLLTLDIYGNMNVADTIVANGGSCIVAVNVFGNFSMTTGSVIANGGSSLVKMNINGNLTMTGGSVIASGGSSKDTINVKGNFSASGPSYISAFGGSAAGCIFFSLPAGSGIMSIDNTSTGAWVSNDIYVDAGCTAQLDGNFSTTTGSATYGVTVNGTLICPAAYVANGSGIFTVNGAATLEVASASGINGAITTTGTKTFAPTANYVFNGTAAQVTGSYLPAALATPDTITVNNTAGVTLSQATLTTGTLLFASGILNTGTYTMSVPGAATAVAGAGAANYVNGTLIKTISGLTSVNYEVGDMDYAPMALTLSSAGTAGSLGLKATNGLHPSVATSGLSSANMANHYWTITNYAATGPVTITPKATYNLSDIIGGSNAAFATQEYTGGAWLGTSIPTTNTSSPYTSMPTTAIAEATIAGDYIFGNIFCGTLPITGAAVTCAGTTTALGDATTGGVWSSSAATIATVSATGTVAGVAGGTTVITYTKAGCTVTDVVTINPLPSVDPIPATYFDTTVCLTQSDPLTDLTTGGVWSSFNTAVATVGSSSGVVEGVVAGVDSIFYTVTNGCGSATAKLHVRVLTLAACRAGVTTEPAATMTELKIFPNPNSGTFIMNLSSAKDDEEVHVVIMNITGTKVREFTTTTNKATDVNLAPVAGIYLVSASTASGVYFAKLIVE